MKYRYKAYFAIFTLLAVFVARGADVVTDKMLDEVRVIANRPMSEIGLQKTVIDSVALRENISLSMADVLNFGSSLFVKSAGRATLSTVSFRGTAPSHTVVVWNGLPINSPALGMTDFSLIPAYLIDRASLYHGSSSLMQSSGGLGGMIDLSNSAIDIPQGFSLQYVQGVGSFTTLDQFLRLGYAVGKWSFSTRAVYSYSKNDFKFVNTDKMLNIYDDDNNIISQYHPTERNENGGYSDFHLLQQIYFQPNRNNRLGLNFWYIGSSRNIAPTTVDYIADRRYLNKQRENTFRGVLSWDFSQSNFRLKLNGGYAHTWLAYDYGFTLPNGYMNHLTESRTNTDTYFLKATADWLLLDNLMLSAKVALDYNNVCTTNHANFATPLAYDESRLDAEASISARWQTTRNLALTAMISESMAGRSWSPVIPALFVDYALYRPLGLMAKASIARNYHAPTLNDMYFQPGGNPDLESESGFTYDVGLSMSTQFGIVPVKASATWFDSYIDNWIIWLPTNKGFFSPRNMKSVHSSGVEVSAEASVVPFKDAAINLACTYSWTRSVNNSEALSQYDNSVGKQLPYVPLHSFSSMLGFDWRQWTLLLKGSYYSKRYTMSSNEDVISGSLPGYFVCNLTLERRFSWRPLDLSAKLAINNLFDADYQTVMSHPMPGINFEVFLSITPKFGK